MMSRPVPPDMTICAPSTPLKLASCRTTLFHPSARLICSIPRTPERMLPDCVTGVSIARMSWPPLPNNRSPNKCDAADRNKSSPEPPRSVSMPAPPSNSTAFDAPKSLASTTLSPVPPITLILTLSILTKLTSVIITMPLLSSIICSTPCIPTREGIEPVVTSRMSIPPFPNMISCSVNSEPAPRNRSLPLPPAR